MPYITYNEETGLYEIDKEVIQLVKSLNAQQKKIEKKLKPLLDGIKKEHAQLVNTTTNYDGGIQVQTTASYITLEFDLDKFKEENQELYEKYLKAVYKAGQTKLVVQKEKVAK